METPEARELSLVGKVEMRIALANDASLSKTLNTYLAPLLLKLTSDFVTVRNKVISVCQHINTRIKPPSIKLPVATLLRQYKDNHNALVRHFDLLYIQQGVDRLAVSERLDLLPNLLHGLRSNAEESATHAASLFNLLLKLLHSMTLPARGSKDDVDLREKLGLSNKADDATFVATWLGKLLLFGIGHAGATRCPGLTTEDCNFLQLYGKKETWTPNAIGGLNLLETKVVSAKFLASGAFVESERFLPALFASADPNSRLSDIGDDILKRATSAVSFEDTVLVQQLYEIYLGTRGAEGSLPARVPLQTKILIILCKSKLASSFVPQSSQIVQEGLAASKSAPQDTSVSPPKQGLEASRLRGQIFAFTNWLARISSPADLNAFAPDLVTQLRNYIENQGWPRFNTETSIPSAGELTSRALGYESIGLLAGACADKLLLEPELDLLQWLFMSLSEDPSSKDVSISIEQALSSVLGAFGADLRPDLESSLTSLLLHHMGLHPPDPSDIEGSNPKIVRSTRFVAVRFANRCLPYRSTTARWIDILAIDGGANERSEVLEEGRKGLDPYWYRMLNPTNDDNITSDRSLQALKYDPPSFPELVEKIFGSGSVWDVTNVSSRLDLGNAYISALTFCRSILLHQALTATKSPPTIDADWERNIDALIANDEDARNGLKEYFRNYLIVSTENQAAPRALKTYLQASYTSMNSSGNGDANRGGDFLLELCSLLPDAAYIGLSANLSSLQGPVFSTKKTLREKASHVFGLLASLEECPDNQTQKMLKVFDQKIRSWHQAIGSEILQVHGSILTTAYFLSRSISRHNLPSDFDERRSAFITTILDILNDSRDKTLLDAVFVATSELALFGALTPETIPNPHNVRDLAKKITEKAKEGDEKAITALGHLALQCSEESDDDAMLYYIIKQLYDLYNVRQPEVQFAVGAALCCAAVGWQSKSLISTLDIQGASPKSPARASTISSILDKVLSDCKTSKPALRQASVIWLLCLVQYCGHMQEIQGRLRECQVAFKGFLADRDSLNQESASRGLALVYDKGNKSLKDELIRDLVSSFTGSAGLAGKGTVSEDTELFDPGALPTGEGSVTTYKDIMSLAAEVQDPSLVYRFMSLASNNAIWSERAAFGKFGLSNILSEASTDGYLAQNPKIYPALFRYRFDPNTNVRNSMNDIWAALVKEPGKTIDLHFDSIMNDLLKNILGKEWRVRQASCAAIADLVQGRPLERYEKYLTKIWELTFKVCDDIKESVRGAAMSLARVLTGVLTRGLEAGESSASSAEKMLKQVLPFLLSPSGLESGAPEVQDFARKTLLKIIKSSNGKTLRPFIPDLVGRLLALLSSIEPEMINYVHLNAEQYGLTAQELDDARLKNIRGSSMLEAIERCLDFLDETSMPELQQSFENAIKTVVGLPSKVGCSRVLVTLSTRQNFLFKPYADHFLALALKQVFDRNDTISSSYAAASGYLARLCSNEAILKLVDSCRRLYFDSHDDRHRVISGDVIHAMSKYATDRFNSLAGDILPFVFVAKHDTSDRAKTLFEDTWSENVGGSRAVLLYLKEIVDLASQHLDSARWSVKHTSAFAVADVVNSSGNAISDANARMVWPALEKALSGKTWEGKEIIVEALISLAKNSTFWSTDQKVGEHFEKIVLRESKRNNPVFRQHALECLGDFVELREAVDMFSQVLGVTKPIIEEILSDSDEMDVDSKSGGPSSKSVTELTLANSSTALLKSVNPWKRSGKELVSSLMETLELVGRVRTGAASRLTLNAIYDAQKKLFERLNGVQHDALAGPLETILVEYVKQLFSSSEQVEQTRLKASEAAVSAAPLVSKGKAIKRVFAEELATARAQERSGSVQQSLDRARKILDG
ncbi:MAG: proteasome component M29 [Alectoria fallacina]|uniref:Proteasome component M29 n=1 Tax=Alectoria fallacina TaxID=1903189 RepID=A0A8H3FYT1_9LECA|nr:MAG: proteasome component M29 [Alectoria fallacina]